MISLTHQFLFLHIPKSAGNSIQNILKDYSEEHITCLAPHQDGIERFELSSDTYEIHKHSRLCDYQQQLGKETIDELFKFTCIRNPWERVISYYFSPHRGPVSWDRNEFIELVNNVAPVLYFVQNQNEKDSEKQAFRNLDAFIRFENLQADFNKVCEQIGIPSQQLPRRNASNHECYSSYYDSDLIDLVRQRFHHEIDLFGYEFQPVHNTTVIHANQP